jgi:hypothetical protein
MGRLGDSLKKQSQNLEDRTSENPISAIVPQLLPPNGLELASRDEKPERGPDLNSFFLRRALKVASFLTAHQIVIFSFVVGLMVGLAPTPLVGRCTPPRSNSRMKRLLLRVRPQSSPLRAGPSPASTATPAPSPSPAPEPPSPASAPEESITTAPIRVPAPSAKAQPVAPPSAAHFSPKRSWVPRR